MIDVDTLIACGASYKQVNCREYVFREGDKCQFYYQLVRGSIRWVNITDEGKEFIQSIIEPGECFGETPLFDDGIYAASAIANSDSIMLRLHKHTFLKILKENQDLHFAFCKLLSENLRFKFLWIKELACKDPEQQITTLFHILNLPAKIYVLIVTGLSLPDSKLLI